MNLTNVIKHGNFKTNRTNKGLSRPRSETQRTMSSCVSQGCGGNGGQGMSFQSSKPMDLWGRK